MQLSGDISKTSIASVINLVRNGKITGEIVLSFSGTQASVFVRRGKVIHAETDNSVGAEALLDLCLWSNGKFNVYERDIPGIPEDFKSASEVEQILQEGAELQQKKTWLDRLNIDSKTILALAVDGSSIDSPLVGQIDGKRTLSQVLNNLKLSRREYIEAVFALIEQGLAEVVREDEDADKSEDLADDWQDEEEDLDSEEDDLKPEEDNWQGEALTDLAPAVVQQEVNASSVSITLPDWVISRLKQDNPDLAMSIVEMVVFCDRIKCWLYQTEANLAQVMDNIKSINIGQTEVFYNLLSSLANFDSPELARQSTETKSSVRQNVAVATKSAASGSMEEKGQRAQAKQVKAAKVEAKPVAKTTTAKQATKATTKVAGKSAPKAITKPSTNKAGGAKSKATELVAKKTVKTESKTKKK